MQLSARYKAVFELMTEIFADRQPADNIINAYFRERRFIGGGDRRFISDKIWDIIRRRRRLTFEAGSADIRRMLLIYLRAENLSEIFSGGQYGLAPVSRQEEEWLGAVEEKVYPPAVECECPDWLFAKIGDCELLKSLNRPAGADFRVNRGSRAEVIRLLNNEGFEVEPTPYSPLGVRSVNRINLNNCAVYHDGRIEVQDEASQLAALLCDVQAHHRAIDYCCGAGGKALAIASLLNGKGCLEAHDIDCRRLEQLKPRMQRLGISNIRTVSKPTAEAVYDRFIIDAPCSGTGTWRRSPDAKFRLTEARLQELNTVQAEILETAYSLTKVGGRIIYITCSILAQENDEIIQLFMKKHQDIAAADISVLWQEKTGRRFVGAEKRWLALNPLTSGTDGFFVCVMEKH